MKNVFLTSAMTIMTLSAVFAQQLGNVVFFAEQGEKFTVIINGVQMNDVSETNVKVTDLNNGFVTLKVRFDDTSIPDMDKSTLMLSPGNEVTYKIKKNKKGEYTLAYAGEVPLANATVASGQRVIVYGQPAGTITTTTTGGTGGTVIQQGTSTTTTTTTTGGTVGGTTGGVNVNVGVPGVGMNVTITDNLTGGTVGGTTTTYSSTTTTTTTGGTVGGTTTTTSGCVYGMSDTDFRSALSTISGQSFDESRLSVAKQVASSNCLTAAQVRQVMDVFSFEETKLDFVKYAYPYCYDRNNYFKVNDGFSFSSSVDDLNTYISTYR